MDSMMTNVAGKPVALGLPDWAEEWRSIVEATIRFAFARHGELSPIALVHRGEGVVDATTDDDAGGGAGRGMVIGLDFTDDAAKAASMAEVRQLCAAVRPRAVAIITEAWLVECAAAEGCPAVAPSAHPARQEVVLLTVEVPGAVLVRKLPIRRGQGCAMLEEGSDILSEVVTAGGHVAAEGLFFWLLPENVALRAAATGHD